MQEIPQIAPYSSDLVFREESLGEEAEKLLSWFKKEIDHHILIFLKEKEGQANEISKEAADLVKEVERFILQGGKRVRPAFLYSGYIASGGMAHDAALYASMCVEFLHTFALMHDDIIDRSNTRRGALTTHKSFEGLFSKRRLLGNKVQFGLSAAILAGDLSYSFAEEILSTAPFPQERIKRARHVFDQMKFQVISGEYLDVLGGYRRSLSEEEILNILEYKTAKYTVERPLHLGATLAGAEVHILETFTAYAIPLGQAFQLQDDIFGVFGDKEKMGKPIDSDIREGKKTVLIAKAYEWARPDQKKVLKKLVGASHANKEEINEVRDIIYKTGAYDYAVSLSHRLIEQAVKAAESAKLNERGKEYLLAAADYLLNRV